MVTTGIERILISVGDMDESLAFYRDWVGMEIIAEQNIESDEIEMEVAPHGMINTTIVEGPSKVMVEFYEKR
jgi:catechol 2,3-dioxygenase-like lactoylglutathione lyase family enzyme